MFGADISEVHLWLQLPITTLYKFAMRKKEAMNMSSEAKTSDITYRSQKEAEIEWLKETQSQEVLDAINFNDLKV